MSGKPQCIVILSTKSSGSSALQELLCDIGGARHVQHTRHGEYETLYWTKAASILGLPQVKLPDSEVPIPRRRALRDLRTLLTQNVPDFVQPTENERLIFDGWRALCCAHGPSFVEKSPHHLHQWSSLELLVQAVRIMPDIDFRFVGLVRNPMDVLYSAWRRWRLPPESFQQHWRQAFNNLERLQRVLGHLMVTVRYEDFSPANRIGSKLLAELGLSVARDGIDDYIHSASRNLWKADRTFGFQLDDEVTVVAMRYGYASSDLINQRRLSWPVRRLCSRSFHRWIVHPLTLLKRQLRNRSRQLRRYRAS